MTEYSRVGDSPRICREFFDATDQHLSVLIDYLTTPRPESAMAKIRAKLPSHWITVLPSLHSSDGLLFLDERPCSLNACNSLFLLRYIPRTRVLVPYYPWLSSCGSRTWSGKYNAKPEIVLPALKLVRI